MGVRVNRPGSSGDSGKAGALQVVKSIPVECQQDLPLTRFGKLPHALFDAFLFECASEKQQFLYRLNPRLVNAEDAGPIPFDVSADVHPRQTIHIDQVQHFALLRIRQSLNRRPHAVLLEPFTGCRERIDVKLIRFPRHPDGTGL